MFRVGVDGSPHIKKIRKENLLESAGGRVFSLNKSFNDNDVLQIFSMYDFKGL